MIGGTWLLLAAFALASNTPDVPGARRMSATAAPNSNVAWTCHRNGGLALLSIEPLAVREKHALFKDIGDVTRVGHRSLAIAMTREPELRFVQIGRNAHTIYARTQLSSPASRVLRGSRAVYASSPWTHAITRIALDGAGRAPVPIAKVERLLPFPPSELALADRHLLAADAFSGRLAVLDRETLDIVRVASFEGHAVRAVLVRDGDVYVAHQRLDRLASTRFDDVHWGFLIQNRVSRFAWSGLLEHEGETLLPDEVFTLGDVGRGASDPGGLAFDAQDRLIVTLSGVDELGIVDRVSGETRRLRAGDRPTRMLRVGANTLVTCEHDGSVIVLRADGTMRSVRPFTRDEIGVSRGERLFHDATLSHDGWMSCHSCHVDGHTSGGLADTLADGTRETPKRVPTLLGTRDTAPYAWNGSHATLREQIAQSLQSTMHSRSASDRDVEDLARYVSSLEPPPKGPPSPAARAGAAVFERLDCSACHAPPTFTTDRVVDVGFQDERRASLFNPPSLRGLRYRTSFFHDGRARTLEAALENWNHAQLDHLTDRERRELYAYLRSL